MLPLSTYRARMSPYYCFIVICLHLVPFLGYSALNNDMTSKFGLGSFKVTKMALFYRPIDHKQLIINPPL